jgi:hypothetical protein
VAAKAASASSREAIASVLRKLGLNSRAEAAAYAARLPGNTSATK